MVVRRRYRTMKGRKPTRLETFAGTTIQRAYRRRLMRRRYRFVNFNLLRNRRAMINRATRFGSSVAPFVRRQARRRAPYPAALGVGGMGVIARAPRRRFGSFNRLTRVYNPLPVRRSGWNRYRL